VGVSGGTSVGLEEGEAVGTELGWFVGRRKLVGGCDGALDGAPSAATSSSVIRNSRFGESFPGPWIDPRVAAAWKASLICCDVAVGCASRNLAAAPATCCIPT